MGARPSLEGTAVSDPADVADPATGPVLAIFAHPDDAEISCGGTLAKWCAAGREGHLLILTNGDRGSDDPERDRVELAATRALEAQAAGGALGLTSVQILDVHDGELQNTLELRAQVVRIVRELRPQTVVSCDPTAWFFDNSYYNHADHRCAGEVALDAVFPGSGNPHYFPEQLAEGLDAWPVHDVWLAWTLEANHREDVAGFMDAKLVALEAHSSQVEGDLLGFFQEWLPKEAAEEGAKIGVRHAEAFRRLILD